MPPGTRKILWADDEIDMLRPHILYLESKGYEVEGVSSGEDALKRIEQDSFDIVLLDEMMPGMGGLATLELLMERQPSLPVIMITKSEEENLMDLALGRQIRDYLTKPVNPSQIFLAIKKVFESENLQRGQRTRDYVSEFNEILTMRHGDLDWKDWTELYRRVVGWDLELRQIHEESLRQSHNDQKTNLNREFGRFVEEQYPRWVNGPREKRPPLSVDILPEFVIPHLKAGKRVALIVIDCMRYDQWLALDSLIQPYFQTQTDLFYSVLPTATPYSRNAIFSGLFPLQIAKKYPRWWMENAPDETSLNRYEQELAEELFRRHGYDPKGRHLYMKLRTAQQGNNLRKKIGTLGEYRCLSIVFNFVDMLAHGRSESDLLKELAPDEEALRGLLQTWFRHSSLFEVLRVLSRQNTIVVVTTDHGVVQCKRSTKALGDRDASTSIRYKYGNNLVCEPREAVHIKKPEQWMLPGDGLIKHYILAKENFYFVYPTNFHHYERHYRGSFQHGGISLEEMILPVATLIPRGAS